MHYDFGLRNIQSVMRALAVKRRLLPTLSEEEMALKVLIDINLCKLVEQDEPLFLSFLTDIFPNQRSGEIAETDKLLMATITAQTKEAGLTVHHPWITKVMQVSAAVLPVYSDSGGRPH